MGAPRKNAELRKHRTAVLIRELQAKGATTKDIAFAAGVEPVRVGMYEHGISPLYGEKYEGLRSLARELGLRVPARHVYLDGGNYRITDSPPAEPELLTFETEAPKNPANGKPAVEEAIGEALELANSDATNVLLELAQELPREARKALTKALLLTL